MCVTQPNAVLRLLVKGNEVMRVVVMRTAVIRAAVIRAEVMRAGVMRIAVIGPATEAAHRRPVYITQIFLNLNIYELSLHN